MKSFLFICTHNRCRSILSEAITNHLAGELGKNVRAYSAGSQPVGQVHPLSIKYLEQRGVGVNGLVSQSWNDFEDQDIDMVVTVCDSAAQETCPVWFSRAQQVHWGLRDPSKLDGTEEEVQAAFFAVMDQIESRIRAVMALDLDEMDNETLRHHMQQLTQV